MTVTGRGNSQNLVWTLPGSGIVWGSFDNGVGNFCCGEGTNDGVFVCVYCSPLSVCDDTDVGNFLLML